MSRKGAGRDGDGPFDALGSLGDLLESIRKAAEEGSLSDETTVDFDYNVRTGLGPGAAGRRGHPRFGGTPAAEPDSDPDPDPDMRPTHVTADGDDRLVTADIGDTGVETAVELTATVDDGVLTIAHDGRPVARATIDPAEAPDSWEVTALIINNGVCEARVTPA